ncbi:MAG: tripartite tricarboxylate transporter TctB family protein [Alphaproteobacteria bacterium]|nr:tripartite tricarboxylate transporter TctB family protein [Alphaproteobacteria bacterium]
MSDNVAGRLQQAVAAGVVLALGLWIALVSFSVEDPQPYLFPQLIAVAFVGLAVVAFLRALRGANRTGSGMSVEQLQNTAPAIALMLAYIFVAIPTLGFYAAATLAFFVLYSLYDPKSHKLASTWLMRVAVTAGFMTLIYVVFAMGLRVQTPRGMFI